MRRLVALALLCCAPCWAAMTERYANFDLATGLNDGSSESNAWQSWGDIVFAAGERVNIKKTASRNALGAITQSTSGTAGSPVWLRGYETSIGDGGRFEFTGQITWSGAAGILESVDIQNSTSVQRVCDISGDQVIALNSIFYASGSNSANALRITDSAAIFCAVSSVSTNSSDTNYSALELNRSVAYGCYITGSGNQAAVYINNSFRSNDVSRCVVNAQGDYGVLITNSDTLSGACSIVENTIYDCSDGIHFDVAPETTDTGAITIINNIIYSCSAYGINNADPGADAEGIWVFRNSMGALTSGRINGMQDYEEWGAITLTADPFIDSATGDFRLNNDAGGGALVRAAAAPTDFDFDGTTDNYADVGAMQHQDSGGSGGAANLLQGLVR